MSCRVARFCVMLLALALSLPIRGTLGQQAEVASRGPRFLRATWRPGAEVDASGAEVLRRRVSLELSGVTLDQALKEVTRQANLEISYSPRVVTVDRPVTVHARDITVAAALTELLLDAPVDVSVTSSGQLALVRRVNLPPAPVDTGSVAGRVTDGASGSPLVGATVGVEGTRSSGVTGDDGRYRIGGLTAGSYTLRARYIGYVPASTGVTVRAGEEATADFALARSAQELDQVVVTGTIVPTEVKAVPSPISVITETEIAEQHPRTVGELFRQAVPGGVAFEQAVGSFFGPLSTRGAASLSNNQMKIYIDGIEAANASMASIDPASVERIEVVRGPQAATLYGSDAINGVLQVFTKRGDSTIGRPQVDLSSTLGAIQSPYQGSGALAQQYSGSVRGNSRVASYAMGGSYSSFGNWMPVGSYNLPSAYAGLRVEQGSLRLDLSARYSAYRGGAEPNPALAATGFFYYSKPFYYDADHASRTVAARATIHATSSWVHSITIGDDETSYNLDQTQARFLSPADTLLFTLDSRDDKLAFGYNTSFTSALSRNVTATFTGGIDHYRLYQFSYFTSGARASEGSITPSASQPLRGSRNTTTNTGYFGQLQASYRSTLFLTAGLRAEKNSNFGADLSTPLSPRVGLSYVAGLGTVTLKARGSYGQAIRPPTPGQTQASAGANEARIGNPALGPERQRGWDAGFDVSFGGRGSLSATYYDQVATDGIQYVVIDLNVVPPITQYQNVGRIRNRGLELEGTLKLGAIASLSGQFAITDSRVEDTGPNYTGDLRVGDRPMLVPKYTGGATLSFFPLAGTTIVGGLSYVGNWTGYDWFARNACFGGTAPCRASTRDYIITYPSVAKVNIGITQRLTPWLSGVAVAHNLGNNLRVEETNAKAVMGRVTMIGLEFRY